MCWMFYGGADVNLVLVVVVVDELRMELDARSQIESTSRSSSSRTSMRMGSSRRCMRMGWHTICRHRPTGSRPVLRRPMVRRLMRCRRLGSRLGWRHRPMEPYSRLVHCTGKLDFFFAKRQ